MTLMTPTRPETATLLDLVGHEFRNVSAVLSGYVRMLARGQLGPLAEAQQKAVLELQNSCGKIAGLLDELKMLEMVEDGSLPISRSPIDLDVMVDEAVAKADEGGDRGVTIDRRRDGDGLVVEGDRTRLSASTGALLHAVLREQSSPTAVVVQTSRVTLDGRTMAAVAIGAGDTARIVLEGYSPEARLDEGRGGLGFVLPIARRLVERHHGRIWSSGREKMIGSIAFAIPLKETRS
jgi:signal transduction histidine kinase